MRSSQHSEEVTSWPRISIVVPSYNPGEFLEECITSILDQDYANKEVLVVDGGSTDQSVQLLEKHKCGLAYCRSHPDSGQTTALIEGFEHATGDIFAWLNSDDAYEPGALSEVAKVFASCETADAVYGDTHWIDRNGRFIKTQREIGFHRWLWLHTYNYVPGMSMFWRRSIYERVGGLNKSFDLAMDADLWARFSHTGRILHVPRVWSRCRMYAEQKTQRLVTRRRTEESAILARYGYSQNGLGARVRRVCARCLRVSLKSMSGCYGH